MTIGKGEKCIFGSNDITCSAQFGITQVCSAHRHHFMIYRVVHSKLEGTKVVFVKCFYNKSALSHNLRLYSLLQLNIFKISFY